MVYTNLKTTFTRLPPRVARFRSYRSFSEEQFRTEIGQKLSECQSDRYEDIEQIYLETRGNNKPHMTKVLRKAMNERTRLKGIANKTHLDEDIRKFKNQRNLVVKMNKQSKIDFYKKLDPKDLGNEKAFWRTFKPLMSDKCSNTADKITLVEDGVLLSNDEDVSECFNTYFVNITDTLDIDRAPCITISDPSLHPVHRAV